MMRERLVEVLRLPVDVAGLEAHLDAARLALDREHRGAGHRRRQRLRAAHAAEAGGQDPFAGERAVVVAPADLHERLVGALHDALAADVDPRAGGHLAVHHQALAIELVEMVPGAPVRHQVRVGNQHARCIGVGAEDADRLARLHQQRLVGLELPQRCDDAVEALPVAGGAADAAVDDELARALGDDRVEVVHQHPQRGLGEPGLGRDRGAGRAPDDAGVVDAGHGATPGVGVGNGSAARCARAASIRAGVRTSAAAAARSGAM